QQLVEVVKQAVHGVGDLHTQDPRGVEEALEVVARPEDEELLLPLVPVAAQAGEAARAVVQAVSEDAHARLPVGDDPAAEESVTGEPELLHRFHLKVQSGLTSNPICSRLANIGSNRTPIQYPILVKWTGHAAERITGLRRFSRRLGLRRGPSLSPSGRRDPGAGGGGRALR